MNAQAYSDVMLQAAAQALRDRFIGGQWRDERQNVVGHYANVMRFDDDELPDEGEVFTASFSRDITIEKDHETFSRIREHIAPLIKRELRGCVLRAYRMCAGDHFRAHNDHSLGPMSFVYYLSKGWRWDWGGLLIAIDGEAKAFLPRFNSMVVLGERVPHMVTQVAPWAKEPRYMLAGFLK